MVYTSLNHIVKSVLNQKGYTKHWYYQYLKLAADCLRELHFHSLKNVQTKKIPIDENFQAPFPCDYIAYSKVGLIVGQVVRPLVHARGINRLNNFDEDGNVINYGNATDGYTDEINWSSGIADVVQNENGEHIGRNFGNRTSNMGDGFKEIRERGVFQLSEQVDDDYLIVEYISDGTGLTDAATKVHPYAQQSIETYIEWKASPNRNNNQSPEAIQHWAAVRKLRAAMNNMTVDDVKRIINRNKQSSPK